MTPRVTVIMPAYNRERFIREAIESILAQTFTDLELLVVDDGSTDGTGAIVGAIADPRVRQIHQPHRGISAAMNRGLAEARGEYVARLDSDDVWLPDMLATQVAVLDERPEVGVVYARAQGMEEDGRITQHVWGIAPRFPDDSLRSLVQGDCTSNITAVARRACVARAGGFDETLPTNEDWDLWLRVARHCAFAFTDRVLARFRWHAGSITSRDSPFFRQTLEERTAVLDKLFRDPDLPPAIRAMRADAYRNVHLGVGLRWLGERAYKPALCAFGRALGCGANPFATAVRIAWFTLAWEVLPHYAWGRRLNEWQSAVRRRWRSRRKLEAST
jgi:glycosyltransferase involved in cell wall biosynthesis